MLGSESQVFFNLVQRLVDDDGQILTITNMFDSDGEETDDPDEAVVAIAGPDSDGQWRTYDVSDLEPAPSA